MSDEPGLDAQMTKGVKDRPTVGFQFEDHLPVMAEKLGEEGLMEELCNGFRLLADPERDLITFHSLKRNAALLGMGMDSMKDEELQAMIEEGDLDGDGALDQKEFCVLMIRLSPSFLAEEAHKAAMDDVTHDFQNCVQEKPNGLEK
uniref:EF-hand domain-containing protein n=1 Tax=Picea sitchensis TaxID=3332 RepID=A9NYP3_PICSI|nr:unknown [Picea sitchensis]